MTLTTPYRDNFDGPELPCPRCDHALSAHRIGGVPIEECTAGCHGLFVGQPSVRQIIDEHEHGFADALLHELPRREIRVIPQSGERMYLKCPHCKQVMNRRQFATGAGVVIDVCKPHGMFFDCGELPAVIEFVMAGGLAKAKAKDDERQRAIQREHLADQRYSEMMARHSSSHAYLRDHRVSEGEALVDLLSLLFGP
jgi:Zn-finger nucleic acid-binding protein|nr:zf-TFIIB domain-containing protein [Kofleriaceae bacterium]